MDSTAGFAVALAAIPDDELRSFRAGLYVEVAIAPDLMVWLEAAAGWEMDRRAGRHREMSDLCATNDEAEMECNLVALAILQASFTSAERIVELLDLTAELLCANGNRSSRRMH